MNTKAEGMSKEQMEHGGSGSKNFMYLLGLLLLSIVLMAAAFIYSQQQDGYDRERIGHVGEQRVLSQRLVKYALEAAAGKEEAFGQLQQVRDRFQTTLTYLKEGNPETRLPAAKEISAELTAVDTRWSQFRASADAIVTGKALILSVREDAKLINELVPGLLALNDEVASILVENGASPDRVYIASRQLMLIQRIGNNVAKALEGGKGSATAADRFGRDTALFERVLQGMLKGDRPINVQKVRDEEARAKLEEVVELFAAVRERVGAILEKSPDVVQVQDAAQKMAGMSDALLEDTTALQASYVTAPERRAFGPGMVTVFGAAALGLLLLLGYQLVTEARRRQAQAEAQQAAAETQQKRNEEAILRLLNEISDLADGDLTVQATVTDDFTGAIADSINYTIDALRSLVTTINETTVQVSSAAQETQATAMHLAEASDHQAQQITGASAAINEMAVSIDEVSKNAVTLAQEAQDSVQIANAGADAVQKNIHGMDTIREQIQETSKRIKRLGESSQEIGEIVELINDIADQTNILALNAAIQAAMAGEAGRGFAVVADEVQRLAERSGNATKQIEALVKTIQTDTNEAVISMEQSTSDVVAGAKLAQDAGEALEKIEGGSHHLASLIEQVTQLANQQANAATDVSGTMNVIQEITTQTSAGTSETAASIGNLAELANELRRSVAGFKLPG